MNEHDLFRAIGNAEDEYLIQSEAAPRRRPGWKTVLLAAAIAALGLTTCAAAIPVIYGAIREARLELAAPVEAETEAETTMPDKYRVELLTDVDHYNVVVDFEVPADPPAAIETVYLPTQVPDHWWAEFFYKNGDQAIYGHWCDGDWDDTVYEVMYIQIPLAGYDPEDGVIHGINVAEGCTVESRTLQAGGREVLEVALENNGMDYVQPETGLEFTSFAFNQRYYYWCDGEYLFHLAIPNDTDINDDMIAAFIESLTPGEMPILSVEQANARKSSGFYLCQAWEEHCREQGIE